MASRQHESGDDVFSLTEIQQALAGECEGVPELVTSALLKYAEARKQTEVDEHRLGVIKGICVSYRRTNSDNPRSIEGWVSSIRDSSGEFLSILANDDTEEPLSELDCAARDAAAAAYVYLESLYGSPVDTETLVSAGVDTEELLGYFKSGLQEVWNSENDPENSRSIDQITDLNWVTPYIAEGGMPA